LYSIGQLSEMTKVKVPTIRFYEQKNLIKPKKRSAGNQRRYSLKEAEKLSFIKHARDLGLGLPSIRKLIELNNHPEESCNDVNEIAEQHLSLVKDKIKKLKKLEKELKRITAGCKAGATIKECHVIKSLSGSRIKRSKVGKIV